MKRIVLICLSMVLASQIVSAQDSVKRWTLQECLDYALENNIQLKQTRNSYLSGVEDTKEAKAALLPSVSLSSSQAFTNYPSSTASYSDSHSGSYGFSSRNSYTGTYGVNAGMTLYGGGRLRTSLKMQNLQNRIDALSVAESENDIRVAIVQAYIQVLYAGEAVDIAVSTAQTSQAQCDRAKEMWQVGSISKVDYSQLESQYKSDEYQVVVARATLDNYKLELKQLLELDITDEIDLSGVSIGEIEVVRVLPPKAEIYAAALDTMPEIRRGELAVEEADLSVRQARSGFYPSLALSASIGTGHMSGGSFEKGSQIWNRFNENIGLTLNVPIFSNRQNRTATNKARIAASNSRLEQLDLQKTLLRKVESAYLDAVSAQSQYIAAVEKQTYAQQSYELTGEQFRVGMKNTIELITAQNEYSSARQEVLQAKYMALLNIELLNIYQGRDVQTI